MSCGASKETEQISEAVPAYENTGDVEGVARDFASAIIAANYDILEKYQVNIGVMRLIMPPKEQSDEILEGMLLDFNHKRGIDLQSIQQQIEDNNVDRAKLKYKDYIFHNEGKEDPRDIKVLEVVLDHAGQEVKIPVTVTELHGKWYLFEILNTTNLFN